jgi:1,2-diacylglycerol-3-alpha-glucose alpha-1,2-galactosyltransferase
MNKHQTNVMYVHFIPGIDSTSIKLPYLIRKIFNHYVEAFYRKSDELVVVNPFFIKELEKIGIKADRVTYIPNFVSKKSFYPMQKSDIDGEIGKICGNLQIFTVLGVGQVQTRKGFDDFVELARMNPDINFIWAGGFSFKFISHGYRKYKKLLKNTPENFKLLGIISREKMNDVFNAADMFFMPSHLELFPMAILEAANCHKPILLRDLNLYKPILFDNYLKGNDVEEFSHVINTLKNDHNLYNEYAKKAEDISDLYSEENLKVTWKNYYQKIYDKYHK